MESWFVGLFGAACGAAGTPTGVSATTEGSAASSAAAGKPGGEAHTWAAGTDGSGCSSVAATCLVRCQRKPDAVLGLHPACHATPVKLCE